MYSHAPSGYSTSNGYSVYSPQTSRPYIQPARIQLAPQDPRMQPRNDNRDRGQSGGNTSSTQSSGSSSQRYSNSPNNLSEEARKKQADISMEKGTYELLKRDELKTEQEVKKLEAALKGIEEDLRRKRDQLKRYREKKKASKRKIDQLEVELARINNQMSNSRSTSSQRTSNATSISFTSPTIANKNMLLAEVNKLLASANTESPTTPSENIRSSLVYGTQVTTRNVVFSKLTLRYNVLTPELMAPQIFIPLKGFKTQFRGTSIRDPRKILLRICEFDQKRNYQIDHINCKFQITINNVMVFGGKKYPLRGPLDITKNIIEGINSLEIKSIETLPQGALNEPLPSCCGICIIQGMKLEPQSTITMLKSDVRYRRTENDTQILIKSKFVKASSSQDVCDVSDVRVPLVCPLTKLRLTLPSFGVSCSHLTFFSGDTFVELNQNKDDWSCPVCKKTIGLDELRVDGLIMRILSECKEAVQQVTFDKYAQWKPVEEEQATTSKSTVSRREEVLDDTEDIITLEDSDEEPPTCLVPSTQARVATCSSIPTSSAPSNSQLRMIIRLPSTQSTSSAQPSSQTVEPTPPRQPSPVYPVETTERSSPPEEEEAPSSSSRRRESSEESEPIIRPKRHTKAPRYAVDDSSSSRSRSTTPATSVSRSSDDEDNRQKKKKTTKKRPRLTSSEESSSTDTDSDSDSSTDRRHRKPGPKSKTLPKKNTASTSNTSKRVTKSKKPSKAAAKKAKSYLYS